MLDPSRPVDRVLLGFCLRPQPTSRVPAETLGFTDVYHFRTGKQDWMGAGLPTEGTNTHARAWSTWSGGTYRCAPSASGSVTSVIESSPPDGTHASSSARIGWCSGCSGRMSFKPTPHLVVEPVMRPGPSTYRPFVSVEEMRHTMIERSLEFWPVTTSDGKLVGLVRKQDVGIH